MTTQLSSNFNDFTDNLNINIENRSCRFNNHNRFLNKKCWICLETLEFDNQDQLKIQQFFNDQNNLILFKKKSTNDTIYKDDHLIELRLYKDKYVLSACKCRKKLAHKICFNNHIDLKQNGNIKVDIFCTQCNYKYVFFYEYNNFFLKLMDFIEIFFNNASYIFSGAIIGLSSYWCCFSYSAATLIQIFGYEACLEIFNNSSTMLKILVGLIMPFMPLALVSARYISWERYLIKILPNCLYSSQCQEINGKPVINEAELVSNSSRNSKHTTPIRLIVGGLMLPTIAITIDKFILKSIFPYSPILLRTFLSGLAFVSVKGLIKIVYSRRKKWQKINRQIQDYKF